MSRPAAGCNPPSAARPRGGTLHLADTRKQVPADMTHSYVPLLNLPGQEGGEVDSRHPPEGDHMGRPDTGRPGPVGHPLWMPCYAVNSS
jgi:hypothetical protein